ncbi:hypothetical protein VZ94_04635, partial [Methylocucumis oryzae]
AIEGGALIDHLYGGESNDTLTGNDGNDYLEGGLGDDTYIINEADGVDTLLDIDGQGSILYKGEQLDGGLKIAENTWVSADHLTTYTLSGDTLFINENIQIQGFTKGDLGIDLPNTELPKSISYYATEESEFLYSEDERESASSYSTAVGEGVNGIPKYPVSIWYTEGYRYHALPDFTAYYYGLGGNDYMGFDIGNDCGFGGEGNDFMVSYNGGKDSYYGGDGNDFIQLYDPNDKLFHDPSAIIAPDNGTYTDGGAGDDIITITRHYVPGVTFAGENTAYLLGQHDIFDYILQDISEAELISFYANASREQKATIPFAGGFFPELKTSFWQNDVLFCEDTSGALYLFPTFEFSTPTFTANLHTYSLDGNYTFHLMMVYWSAEDNHDTSSHTLFGGEGNDFIEGGVWQ